LKELIAEDIHRRAAIENFKVLQYFKGGSDAVTILVEKESRLSVRKISASDGNQKLRNQRDWLLSTNSTGIVKCIGSKENDETLEIELEYIDDSNSFFQFLHFVDIDTSKNVTKQIWNLLTTDVYAEVKFRDIEDDFYLYLDVNFYSRLKTAALHSIELNEILDSNLPLYINGIEYDNLQNLMKKIMSNSNCRDKLFGMTSSTRCHGDLTVDNILIRDSSNPLPILIDPSDDNILKGPLIDASRLMQSLRAGYEFLNEDISTVRARFDRDAVYLDYSDYKSQRYEELSRWVTNEILPEILTNDEILAINFHVGVFYARMLTHRLNINHKNALKYFAVSIVMLDKFYKEVS
jgi:hypothetical protein